MDSLGETVASTGAGEVVATGAGLEIGDRPGRGERGVGVAVVVVLGVTLGLVGGERCGTVGPGVVGTGGVGVAGVFVDPGVGTAD